MFHLHLARNQTEIQKAVSSPPAILGRENQPYMYNEKAR
jgi:hypothetical protein